MRDAVAFRSSSPAAWPCTSLISLKRSRSTIISASSPSRAFMEAMSFSSRSWKEARFGKPVSVSKCARKRMRCSAARRSRRSRTAKILRTAPSASVLREMTSTGNRTVVGAKLRLEALRIAVAGIVEDFPDRRVDEPCRTDRADQRADALVEVEDRRAVGEDEPLDRGIGDVLELRLRFLARAARDHRRGDAGADQQHHHGGDEIAEDGRVDRLRRDRDRRVRRDRDRRHADEVHDGDAGGEQQRRDDLDVAPFVPGAADGKHRAGDAKHRAHEEQRRVPVDLAGDLEGSPWR